jgi:DNA-3-methyladenine glycosylase
VPGQDDGVRDPTAIRPAAGRSVPGAAGRRPLPRSFFAREPTEVARDLIGSVLVTGSGRDRITIRLTETEAYHGEQDPASHAYRGRTTRTAVMFGPPGFLYVYFVYGMHWCANIVTGVDGEASAVLLRAGEVAGGLEIARDRRRSSRGTVPRDVDLARGPARLAATLGLTGTDSGADLCRPGAPFRVHPGAGAVVQVQTGPRVGVAAAGDIPWRYFDAASPTVSAYRAGGRRRTR